jgi:hypothetical protein
MFQFTYISQSSSSSLYIVGNLQVRLTYTEFTAILAAQRITRLHTMTFEPQPEAGTNLSTRMKWMKSLVDPFGLLSLDDPLSPSSKSPNLRLLNLVDKEGDCVLNISSKLTTACYSVSRSERKSGIYHASCLTIFKGVLAEFQSFHWNLESRRTNRNVEIFFGK